MKYPRRVLTTTAIGVIMLGTAGVAVASIPSANGTIAACYAKPGLPLLSPPAGTLRVIDSPGQSCTGNEIPLSWNQTGPAGPQGPQGPTGPPGSTTPVVSDVTLTTYAAPGSTIAQTATCPSGTVVTGGGFTTGPGVQVLASSDITINGDHGWHVEVYNPTDTNRAVVTRALCLKLG